MANEPSLFPIFSSTEEGELDVRELISLFPLLLPADADFNRSVPPLHEMADVTQITRNDADKMAAVTQFLVEYLEAFRWAEGEVMGVTSMISLCLINLLLCNRLFVRTHYICTYMLYCPYTDALSSLHGCHPPL